ncbi:hypothetical protein SDC9_141408 [bioreactor metagenome]|uniref:Uncharacterized protein n=1 Tax=bioreactor metagenome TaxID=1076179 RepID=A0A645E0Z7_9ZZZZ
MKHKPGAAAPGFQLALGAVAVIRKHAGIPPVLQRKQQVAPHKARRARDKNGCVFFHAGSLLCKFFFNVVKLHQFIHDTLHVQPLGVVAGVGIEAVLRQRALYKIFVIV